MSETIPSPTRAPAAWRSLVPLTAAIAAAHVLLAVATASHAETPPVARPAVLLATRTVAVAAAAAEPAAPKPAAKPAPKPALKEPAKAPAKEPAKDPAKVTAAREPAKEPPKESLKETPKEPPKVPATAVALATPEAASAAGNAPPSYTTRMPAPVTMRYDMHRGAWSGTGELAWQPAGERYRAHLEGRVAGFKVMTWHSEGVFDAAGIAPVRFTDQRRGKSMLAANFQRVAQKITYSGTTDEHLLLPGAQDRLSWMVQIAAIASADPQRVAPGRRVSMLVSGARGDADVWSFQGVGTETVTTGAGAVATVKMLREPRKPRDTRVEVWLDPKQGYLPVRARLSSTDGDALELLQRAVDPS